MYYDALSNEPLNERLFVYFTAPPSSSRTPLCSRPNPKDLPSRSLCRSDSSAKSHASLPTFRGIPPLREKRKALSKPVRYKRTLLQLSLHKSPDTVIAKKGADWPIRTLYGWKWNRASLSKPTLRPSRIIFPSGKLKPLKGSVNKGMSGCAVPAGGSPRLFIKRSCLKKGGGAYLSTFESAFLFSRRENIPKEGGGSCPYGFDSAPCFSRREKLH